MIEKNKKGLLKDFTILTDKHTNTKLRTNDLQKASSKLNNESTRCTHEWQKKNQKNLN